MLETAKRRTCLRPDARCTSTISSPRRPTTFDFTFRGAPAESFANTLPLLHPRGYLQVQDIFVSSMDEYRQAFKGPGKLDGSLVVWVNGALLRAVGARAGYDVHFAPFPYRPGSKTNVLYTTQSAP